MVYLLFAVLGLLSGGVVNLLADDLPARIRPGLPHCPNCKRVYAPAGWLAVGRYLQNRGKCQHCGFAAGRRPLLVELALTILFVALPTFVQPTFDLIMAALYLAILTLILVIDSEHRLILHIVTFPATLLALIASFFLSNNSLGLAVVGALIGFAFFYLLYWVAQLAYGPGALGFGDVTLAMTLGAMLGFPIGLFALVAGILLGFVVSFLFILTGRYTRHTYIAYGVFLALGGMFMVIWGQQVLVWYWS